ncbi:MAG: hypothetical protein FJ118_06075 [Deltaproteobacteria bacterium]|nr:hypothetical protein [Deltaproteobacteria bacterium]
MIFIYHIDERNEYAHDMYVELSQGDSVYRAVVFPQSGTFARLFPLKKFTYALLKLLTSPGPTARRRRVQRAALGRKLAFG